MELLVVVSIIAALMALLLPAITRAMERSRLVACAANLRQCGIVNLTYASDNRAALPWFTLSTISQTNTLVYPGMMSRQNGTGWYYYKIVPVLSPYLPSFAVWRCGALASAAPIDALDPTGQPLNNRSLSYCTYDFFPWRNFGDRVEHMPGLLATATHPSTSVLMADLFNLDATGVYTANHARAPSVYNALAGNPSRAARTTTAFALTEGANELCYDGHAEWIPAPRLTNVGCYRWGDTAQQLFSIEQP